MKNDISPLKIQAYLDGELSGADVRQVTEWLAEDAEARALLNELTTTRGALAGNETVRPCPETREFYWSQIQREILAQEKTTPRRSGLPIISWIRQHFAATGGLAVATAALVIVTLQMGIFHSAPNPNLALGTVEPGENVEATYFRSEEDGMTVVWLTQK